ncbi:ubiquinone biosynthesis accessory factor UbiJ [Oligella sp. MSHR50489EDL]|uniref:ubiquinone biosynthesis accessory factor UbiJ n=1 Tax=Oligella sp. MSHR50489EDL TaxID=3139409 RepID=UPI003D818219
MVRLFNSLLKQEPWAQERMHQYAGKTVKFRLPMSSLALSINTHGLVALSADDAVPNVTVTLKSEDMSALLKDLSATSPAKAPDIKRLMSYVYIEGEAGLANLVSDLARDLRWDRQYYLANLLGPVLTSHLLRTERVLLEKGQEGVTTLLRVGADSLSYDQEILVPKVQFNDLNRELEALEKRFTDLENVLAKGQ